MTTRTKTRAALVAAMILVMSGPGLAQTSDDDHGAHHPEDDVTAPENGATMPGAGMAGMGMMTPEMMQMMMRMMGEGGMPGMMPGMMPNMMGAMPGGRMGDGMPGSGRMGPGMMGPGMMGPGMMGGMPMGGMMMNHHGMMGGHGIGPGALYGIPQGETSEMTPARVEAFLSHLLERHGNPRLELGVITQAEDGSIIAEIVTLDGSLVQRLAFNRYPGLFRQID